MKISNEKKPNLDSLSGPPLPPIMGGGSSSAISPLKIWDVLPHYLRIDTVRAKNRKLIILTIFAWTTPLINCGILEPQNLTFPRLQCHYQSGYYSFLFNI